MKKLNLPDFSFNIQEESGEKRIFDFIRKRYFLLTPEEWVRQNFISYLVQHKNYPAGRCAIEKEIKVGHLRRRPDLVVYDGSGEPIMIVEFKSHTVAIDQRVLFQAALYNKKLKVPYFILSNGLDHFCIRLNLSDGRTEFIDTIPEYAYL